MAREIGSLIITQCSIAMNVITAHGRFTEVMCKRGNPQRKAITRSEVKGLPDFVSDRGDTPGVRMCIALETIGFHGEIPENLDLRKVMVVDRFYSRHETQLN
jgi:hypothetical protein